MNTDRNTLVKKIEDRLSVLMEHDDPELLWNSMAYSVNAGGKRIRPVLCLLGASLLTDEPFEALDYACAIELIHTYSLIHDDLPAMDNDVLRRGKPTNHVVFGEAQAILAGDGLLSYAFEIMLDSALLHKDRLEQFVKAASIIANAAGVSGMVAGQTADTSLEGEPIGRAELDYIEERKTAAMIKGALLSGLEIYGPTDEQRRALGAYGENIGMVFQIVDDVLDITAGDQLGKSRGKDAAAGKVTFPTLYGIDGAMNIAEEKTKTAKEALSIFADRAKPLTNLADELLTRVK